MAGAVLARQLRPGTSVTFGIADEKDDAGVRALLRNNPMGGRISISLEREPSYFDNAVFPEETIVARENGRLVCAGSCTIQRRFVNGSPRAVGYLGGLRLDRSHQGRFDILRRGYEFFRELQAESPADFYFTSIASDNRQARALLERGLKGMPRYELVGELVTLLFPTRPFPASINKAPAVDEVVSMMNRSGSLRQLSPWLSVEKFNTLGISEVIMNAQGCGVLWDQRSYKQAVVRDYAPTLKWTRPIINSISRFAGAPLLPAIGQPLSIAFGAFLHGEDKASLIKSLLGAARRAGISLLAVGFDANDPDLHKIQSRLKGRDYRSRIYVVRWPGAGGGADDLDGRLLGPEVALL